MAAFLPRLVLNIFDKESVITSSVHRSFVCQAMRYALSPERLDWPAEAYLSGFGIVFPVISGPFHGKIVIDHANRHSLLCGDGGEQCQWDNYDNEFCPLPLVFFPTIL